MIAWDRVKKFKGARTSIAHNFLTAVIHEFLISRVVLFVDNNDCSNFFSKNLLWYTKDANFLDVRVR